MRAAIVVCFLLGLALAHSPASAQDAEALRNELEQLRKQMETISERLQRLETQPQPAPTQPVVQSPPGAPPIGQLSPLELARPREPFALYQRRGPGQLLFDIGVTGDFIGNLTQHNVQKNSGGSFSGLENLFFPREIDLSLFGQIDPYARAEVLVEAGQDQRGESLNLSLAEANLTLMALPGGFQLKMGQMRNHFGLLNPLHSHNRPFIDDPNALIQFFGKEGLREAGFEATWVAPLPFYVELLGGVFNGQNDVAFGRDQISNPLVTGRVKTFFDFDEWGAIQLGGSVANGQTPEQKNSLMVGFDAKYKYTPPSWQRAAFTLYSEFFYSAHDVEVVNDTGSSGTRQLDRNGWYVGADVRPFAHGELSNWLAGIRYDWTQYPVNPGHEWAVGPFIAYYPSEFLRFRLGYKHTTRSQCCSYLGFQDNSGSAKQVDEYFLQATFVLGAHPAHPF